MCGAYLQCIARFFQQACSRGSGSRGRVSLATQSDITCSQEVGTRCNRRAERKVLRFVRRKPGVNRHRSCQSAAAVAASATARPVSLCR